MRSYDLPFFAFTILVFAAERGRISQHLRGSWLVFLGEISFAFYLLHVLVMRLAGTWDCSRRDPVDPRPGRDPCGNADGQRHDLRGL